MHHSPKAAYNGLTIIMSNPSRFDKLILLSGYAGKLVDDSLAPGTHRNCCDIWTADEWAPEKSLENTRAYLMLGEGCIRKYFPQHKRTINQQRGSPLVLNKTPTIVTYFPQDCCDIKDWEKKFNSSSDSHGTYNENEKEDLKNHGATDKANWKFWLQHDIRKCLRIAANPSLLNAHPPYNIIVYPSSDKLVSVLGNKREGTFYLDIETDTNLQLTCLSFSFNYNEVYVVPIIRYDYTLAYSYSALCGVFRALAQAMTYNEVVCHNAMFDLLVLAWKYRLPFGRAVYDTMLSQHRLFVELEKSLGHCISMWTYLPYHKDEGVFMPNNAQQELALWHYNAKDVYSMMLIYEAQKAYAKTVPGLEDSVRQVNNSIRPYLINSLLGIHFNEEDRSALIRDNDKLMGQCLRCMRILIGKDIVSRLESMSPKGFIMSPAQCVEYLYNTMGYPVLARTDTGIPSTNEQALQKLKLRYTENMVLDLLLKYRELKKQTGSLKFTPWATEPIFTI